MLELGGWRSSAALRYLVIREIGQQAVFASTEAVSESNVVDVASGASQ